MASKIRRNYLPEFFALGFHPSKPRMVTVNVTSKCNQHCVYCEIGENIPSSKQGKLSTDDLKWLLDEMAHEGIKKISLCGGEPFLFDGILDVVEYAGKKNIRCSITSNGMTVWKLTAGELAILKNNQTEINISIDSFDESLNAKTRGTAAALSNALKSIKVLNDRGIPLTVLTAISKYNFHDLYNSFVLARKFGIQQMLFQPIIYFSNYPDRDSIQNKSQLNVGIENLGTLLTELKKILEFEQKHAIKTNVYRIMPWIESYLQTAAGKNGRWFFEEVVAKFYCREIFAIIDISYDGGIQPCGLALATTDIYQNREKGLLALWMEATAKIKEDLSKGNYRDYCNGCCHHFSRNMLASLIKYPWQNRVALTGMLPRLTSRYSNMIYKKIRINK